MPILQHGMHQLQSARNDITRVFIAGMGNPSLQHLNMSTIIKFDQVNLKYSYMVTDTLFSV